MTKEIFQDDWWQLPTEEYDECKVNLKALNARDLDDPTKDVSVLEAVVFCRDRARCRRRT